MTGFTARWFLGVDDGALSQSLEHSGVLTNLIGGIGRLSGAGSSAVGDEVAGAVGELLDVDLGKVLVDGWRTGTQLRDAARETVAAPGTSAVVELARHRVNAAYRPHVDLLVDGRPIGSLKLELSLVFDVHSMQATVRAGRLVGLRCGRCDLTAAVDREDER